jgi:hypothetical protein
LGVSRLSAKKGTRSAVSFRQFGQVPVQDDKSRAYSF